MKSDAMIHSVLSIQHAIPAFNIPFLPMMEPIIQAVLDMDSIAMIAVARIEWMSFESDGVKEVRDEYLRLSDQTHTLLHLDHVPVLDENNLYVDYRSIIAKAIDLGYQSVMVDGSRLPLKENIEAVRSIVEAAHPQGIPVEAELGKVLGHEKKQDLTYEEILRTRTGFTEVEETSIFVQETGCDWLSVACGNIHGSVSDLLKDQKKPEGKLDIPYMKKLFQAAGVPLVLHGGSGIAADTMHSAIQLGVAKVNVGTDVRQAYEQGVKQGGTEAQGQDRVYKRTCELIEHLFNNKGLYAKVYPKA